MDFRYFNYINNHSPYYNNNANIKQDFIFSIDYKSNQYSVSKDSHWTYFINNFVPFPEQGWKIHISTLPKYAQETLDIVSKVLLEYDVSFKFVQSYNKLFEKNSKYANRTASGKFITIYPINNNNFTFLVKKISSLLKHLPKGPYILTDKRWYESNVFFRYGAFKLMYTYDVHQNKVYSIKDPKGNYIEDLRVPYYHLPTFVEEPIEVKEMDYIKDSISESSSKLSNYEILNAIHYSNGGGVYIAICKTTKNKVVIKEGRPGAGLDMFENDAFSRIEKEEVNLKKLENTIYPVTIYDSFIEWEHKFIVEEYIQGTTLNSWVISNYPFYSDMQNNVYRETALYILKQLIAAVKEIHSKKVGIGDLSPNNVLVDSNNHIKIIDFETADEIYKENSIGLNTLGFSGSIEMNREQADWFSLLRIARYLFLPIGPVQDISQGILQKHDQFIEKIYGTEVINTIKIIENKCENLNTTAKSNFINYSYHNSMTNDINEIINKMVFQIKNNLFNDSRLIPGDIRQFEVKDGYLNILNGSFGTLFTFNRLGKDVSFLKDWLNKQSLNDILSMNEGLFIGKTGIATALFENSNYKEATQILDSLNEYKYSNDVTLSSGLAGIGLAYIGFSYTSGFEHYLENAINIANRIETLLEKDINIVPFDIDLNNIGLINGWSGVSLFYIALYKKTLNRKWLAMAKKTIEKDLDLGEFNEDGIYHLNDKYRLMPYIDGGSAGLAYPLIELNYACNENNYTNILKGIKNISNSKLFYNCGFFRGTSGILETYRFIMQNENKNVDSYIISKLKNHLIFTEKEIFTPGDNNFRLSNDLFSGTLGILLMLESVKQNINFLWLPIPNTHHLFYSNQKR